jgi:predicted CoA-binding protein
MAVDVVTAMGDAFAEPDVVRRLLNETKTWAFVGLGDNPEREVHTQARLLQERGKRIVPVHPSGATVLGEQGYAALQDVPGEIDVVGVYRRAEHAGAVVDEAIAAGAKAVWLPLDVIDEAAALRAKEAGLDVVMNRCPAVEWALRR